MTSCSAGAEATPRRHERRCHQGFGAPFFKDADLVDLSSYYNQANLDGWNAHPRGRPMATRWAGCARIRPTGTLNFLNRKRWPADVQADDPQRRHGFRCRHRARRRGPVSASNTRVVVSPPARGSARRPAVSRSRPLAGVRDYGADPRSRAAAGALDGDHHSGQGNLLENPALHGIHIEAGALGPGTPENDPWCPPTPHARAQQGRGADVRREKGSSRSRRLLGLKGIAMAEDMEH